MNARRRGTGPVRYLIGGNNGALRVVLLQEWGGRCYWCRDILSPATAEIDHIIPRTVARAELAKLIDQFNLPGDFDRDRPANLAPICSPCNKAKRNQDFLGIPVVASQLAEARRRAPKIEQRVRDYRNSYSVGHHLIAAVDVNLNSPRTRREFVELAPAVVQALALLDESRIDFLAHRRVFLAYGSEPLVATFTLDARGRTWWAWVEEICGRPWNTLLEVGLRDVAEHVEQVREQAVRTECGTADVVSRDTSGMRATMEIADVSRDGTLMTCHLSGRVEVHYDLHLQDADPGLPESVFSMEAEAEVDAQFLLTVSWDLAVALTHPPASTLTFTDENVIVGIDRRMK